MHWMAPGFRALRGLMAGELNRDARVKTEPDSDYVVLNQVN